MPKAASSLLKLTNLRLGVGEKEVVRGLSLTVRSGEVHAIMGPNGSGKSTLVSSLMGHPSYDVLGGEAVFMGKKLSSLSPDERARLGLFLAFQYPRDIKGVSLRSFLFAAYNASQKKRATLKEFDELLRKHAKHLHIDASFLDRSVNHGFSGGEKKKSEILQLSVLQPRLALLDETDSGLDVDALKVVAEGVNGMRGKNFSAIIVTHYARLLEYIVPDYVHVMVKGQIVESGGAELARKLEKDGYAKYGVKERISLS